MKESRTWGTTSSRAVAVYRTRRLVVVETAPGFILLTVAGLLIRSFQHLQP